MNVVQTETMTDSNDWALFLLQGIAAIVLGLFLITAPAATTVVLVAFLGLYWLVAGIVSLVRIVTGTNRAHWGWSLAVGILGIFAGLIVLRHPLYSGILAPALLVLILGIDALIMGAINLGRTFAGDGGAFAAIAAIDLLFGLILLGSPLVAASILPIALGVFALLGGIALTVFAFSVRGTMYEVEEETVEHKRAA